MAVPADGGLGIVREGSVPVGPAGIVGAPGIGATSCFGPTGSGLMVSLGMVGSGSARTGGCPWAMGTIGPGGNIGPMPQELQPPPPYCGPQKGKQLSTQMLPHNTGLKAL